jgi:hypothetical protein
LEVEDINDEALDITVSEAIKTIPKPHITQAKAQAVEEFELDMGPNADLQFMVFCFYEDVHAMQEFLKETWSKYAAGEIDLLIAAVTTNVGCELIRNAEEEVKSRIPNVCENESSYHAITSIIHFVPSFNGELKDIVEILDRTPEADFIYRSEFISLFKTSGTWNYEKGERYASVFPLALLYLERGNALPISRQWDEWQGDDELLSLMYLDAMNS